MDCEPTIGRLVSQLSDLSQDRSHAMSSVHPIRARMRSATPQKRYDSIWSDPAEKGRGWVGS